MRIVVAAILVFLIQSVPALAGRVALVIGNYEYRAVAPLDNPKNDAAAVAAALRDQGFEVVMRQNLDRAALHETLRAFRDLADRNDVALIYYAGHGIEIAGVNYLVPVDARLEDERDAALEMIDVDLALHQISGARTMKMVVLDACRNNPFVAQMQRRGGTRNVGRGLGDVRTAQADTLIAYAAAAGEVTPDGPAGGNSPFTAAFVAALGDSPADVRQLMGRVRDRMRQVDPGAEPFVYSSLGGGDYVINPKGMRPEPATAAISEDFAQADRAGTAADWDRFLTDHASESGHPLYALALEHWRALTKAAGTADTPVEQPRSAPQVAFLAPAATEPQAPAMTEAEAARKLQTELAGRGCYGGAVDGRFGPNSARSLDAFLRAANLPGGAGRNPPLDKMVQALETLTAHPEVRCPVAVTAGVARTGSSKPKPKKTEPSSSKCAVGWGTGVYGGFGTNDSQACKN